MNGKIEVKTEENVTTAPVTHVVEYNPDATTGEVTNTVERDIPFQTEVIEDPTLEAGKVIREKEGVLGKEKVTTTQKVEGSQPVGDPVVTTETITPAVDAVIRVGTKPADPSVTPGDDNPGTKPGEQPGGKPGGQPGGEPGTKLVANQVPSRVRNQVPSLVSSRAISQVPSQATSQAITQTISLLIRIRAATPGTVA
ncbi:G5 domain-containing protein [Corynebacterium renale]|uniref:G5 domain-containing protein n=1 Tax=Corynebacterium renale TaxID=1724 RepID=UPI0006538F09|nr:G5 domain-containing protein [Corynebacterium renale]